MKKNILKKGCIFLCMIFVLLVAVANVCKKKDWINIVGLIVCILNLHNASKELIGELKKQKCE